MKSIVALGAFVGAAVAQNCAAVAITAIPACAQSCFLSGAPSIGCGGTDFACQCDKEAALYAAVEGCVSSGCPEPSFQAVIDGASSVCACASGIVVATTTDTKGAVTTATSTPSTAVGSTVISYTTSATGTTVAPTATTGSTGATYNTSPTTSAPTGGASTSRTAVTSVSTAGAVPTYRAALGLVGGVAAAAMLM
ncbi:hypothetical protein JX265_000498 [Neoarthrinium moseri]|uniref:CFEM domain-containing protein n=1 Tax=Neoarthrinium moseri TaxID=1658444 RepID=A0A9Q0AWB8_9PEZI|nr:uncharacterized protein JN550_001751 [Neoarthrinium moseri]KAI1841159.1 hypothetical protein JX266_012626 [Neoarthrinium moseri]KAI1876255.1 hypothetical protein JN550_001751 [Neoarthrinium moseri]KAI1881672.1 hypothetical protein JX265_000498 [Neoarthrinium moseri]